MYDDEDFRRGYEQGYADGRHADCWFDELFLLILYGVAFIGFCLVGIPLVLWIYNIAMIAYHNGIYFHTPDVELLKEQIFDLVSNL